MRIRPIFASLLPILCCVSLAQAQAPVDKAWGILKQGVSDKSFETRANTFRALALLVNNPTAQSMAEKALSDERAEVRTAAASALGQMGAKSSIPKLENAARDKDVGVVFAATDAL